MMPRSKPKPNDQLPSRRGRHSRTCQTIPAIFRADGGSLLYQQLAAAIAGDPDVLSPLQAAPETQQVPVLLFAAI